RSGYERHISRQSPPRRQPHPQRYAPYGRHYLSRREVISRYRRMSAIGPKQTWATALHMSAFGGKADMTFCSANVCLLTQADSYLMPADDPLLRKERTSCG